jgi:hypothetical protein
MGYIIKKPIGGVGGDATAANQVLEIAQLTQIEANQLIQIAQDATEATLVGVETACNVVANLSNNINVGIQEIYNTKKITTNSECRVVTGITASALGIALGVFFADSTQYDGDLINMSFTQNALGTQFTCFMVFTETI